MSYKKSIQLKMVSLGEGGVGKTSLINRYVYSRFQQAYIQTLGEDIYNKKIVSKDIKIDLQIHDIAGQERFKAFRHIYMKKANLGFLVYDLTSPISLERLKSEWLPSIVKNIDEKFYLTLIGNKTDLSRSVNEKDVKKLITHIKRKYKNAIYYVNYIETSALKNDNVDTAFNELVEIYLIDNKFI